MSPEEEAKPYFEKYQLAQIPRISNIDCALYRGFGLERLRFTDFLRPSFLWRGFQAVVLKRYGHGSLAGDERQLPGVFLLHQGNIVRRHYYQQPWEHPDFEMLSGLP